jgi:hypothetical protein
MIGFMGLKRLLAVPISASTTEFAGVDNRLV